LDNPRNESLPEAHAIIVRDYVRLIITFCCSAVLCATACADTIVLKNGDRIAADWVKQYDGRVEYWVGNNSMTIPQSIVARIEAGPPPAPAAQPAVASPRLEMPTTDVSLEGAEQLMARVIRNGAVDISAVQAIEKEGQPAQSAVANAIAAGFEERHNNLPAATRYLESALRFLPRHPVLLENYAGVLLQLGRPAEALSAAQQAVSASPQSAEALTILGYAYYKNDRNREAIAALKKALELRPNEKVRHMLDHLERESRTEADFRQQDSNHFTLRAEGSQNADVLRGQVLEILEADYRDLQNELGAAPKNVFVSLYTDQEFFDVTRAPAWSAAVNDGKIRVPVSGVRSVTPAMASVLRHELTHSFIQQIAHGRAPQWLNEGVAELEGGRTTAPYGDRLAALYASGNQVPLNQLEGSFTSYSTAEAAVVYAESLAAVEYIRNTYGMSDVARILQRMGEGQSIESALRNTIHGGYAELEREIAAYLKKNYGT
jgi:tetratricopeptide (TPR) repeat protein